MDLVFLACEDILRMPGYNKRWRSFSYFQKRCRRLRCPLGSTAFYGQCKQLTNGIDGLGVDVQLLLKTLRDQTNVFHGWHRINTTELGKQVYEEIKTVLGLHMCTFCSWGVLMGNNTKALPDFTVVASVRVTPGCQLEMIHDKLRATILRQQLEIALNGQTVVMSVGLDTMSFDLRFEESKALFNIYFDVMCKSIPITTLCPDFKLAYSEVASHMKGKAQVYYLKLFNDFENVDKGTSLDVMCKGLLHNHVSYKHCGQTNEFKCCVCSWYSCVQGSVLS